MATYYVSALLLLLMATSANGQTEVNRGTRPFRPIPPSGPPDFAFRPDPPNNDTDRGGPDSPPGLLKITQLRDHNSPLDAGISTPAKGKVTYNGGPVMNVINVYFIWYGYFTPGAKSITRNFVKSLGFSNPRTPGVSTVSGWWDLVRPLGDSGKNFPAANPVVAGETNDIALSKGNGGKKGLSSTDIQAIVSTKIGATGAFPLDPNGFYAVMTNDSVLVNGWCTQHCGWHTYYTSGTVTVKFAYVAHRAGSCCTGGVGPNADPVSDAATSVFAHELAEVATDPRLDGWYDSTSVQKLENGDVCSWQYGTKLGFNGGVYNMVGRDGQKFLVQQMYDIASGTCLSSAIAPPSATLNALSSLYQNQYLLSPNGRFMAILQVDQNFVVYDGANATQQFPIFASATQFSGAYTGTMKADGSFMLNSKTAPVYSTGASTGVKITMQNDGNLVITNSAGQGVWASGNNSLDSGNGMTAAQFISQAAYFVSPTYRYKLALQADGNLVLYDGAQAKALWASNTAGSEASYLLYGADGNLGLYADLSALPVWQSNTAGQIPGRLAVQDNGNVALYNADNAMYWATNTVQTV